MLDKKGKQRFLLFIIVLCILVIILVVNLFLMMVFSPQPEINTNTTSPLIERGAILDRNGRPLAIQTQLYSIEAWMPYIEDIKETVKILSAVLNLSEDEIFSRLHSNSKSVYIDRKVSTKKSEKIREYKEQGKLKGIFLRAEYGRIYPEQELASHVIGYIGVDNVGLDGIEYTFENELSPAPSDPGKLEVLGNHIVLTLDINIQYILDNIAKEIYTKHEASSVMILAMNAHSGEILGYSSIPYFDPNVFSQYNKEYLINQPIMSAYEPGSAFKIFSLAAMLEMGAINPDDTFTCNGFYEKKLPDGKTIRIGCMGNHGKVTPELIIKYSCNAGAAYASDNIDNVLFYEKLKDFGFGERTGIPLPGETYGIFHEPKTWSGRSRPTIAIGQEISVSAIQMISAATVFTNDGTLIRPLIVKKIISPEGKVLKSYNREEVRQVVSPSVAREILKMMVSASESGGTAHAAYIEGIDIAAKTGTAQVPDPNTGFYAKDKYVASIIGMFPAENPQIILYIVIENPKGTQYFGSRIAAPMFKRAALEIISYLDISQKGDKIISHQGEIIIKKPSAIKVGSLLPDLRGLPKRLLLTLFQAGIDVFMDGEGYVISQSPPPGTEVTSGMKVFVKLK
jgi:cell division protein FtsI (penicillin-binding protein 3)